MSSGGLLALILAARRAVGLARPAQTFLDARVTALVHVQVATRGAVVLGLVLAATRPEAAVPREALVVLGSSVLSGVSEAVTVRAIVFRTLTVAATPSRLAIKAID